MAPWCTVECARVSLDAAEQLAGGEVDHGEAVRRGRAQREAARRVVRRPARHVGLLARRAAQLAGAHEQVGAGPPSAGRRAPRRPPRAAPRGRRRAGARGGSAGFRGRGSPPRRGGRGSRRGGGRRTGRARPRPRRRPRGRGRGGRRVPHIWRSEATVPGEGDDDGRVELADVDPELERVVVTIARSSPRSSRSSSSRRCCRRVAGAVGGDALGELGVARARGRLRTAWLRSSTPLRELTKQITREPPRTSALTQLARLLERGAPRAQVLVHERRVPDRDLAVAAAGAPSRSISRTPSRPVRRSASSTGLAIVAEASRKRGAVP